MDENVDLEAHFKEWNARRARVPDVVNHEYYQISPEILGCFPKYHFPLNLFEFKSETKALVQVYNAEDRLAPAQRSSILCLCDEGLLFVSRSNHDVYTRFVVNQLDLILLDSNLTSAEISSILTKAFALILEDLFMNITGDRFKALDHALDILARYLAHKPSRARNLAAHCQMDNKPENHMVNASFVALALYVANAARDEVGIDELSRVSRGFFLYDIGMARMPKFLINKNSCLDHKEQQRIKEHPHMGVQILEKFGFTDHETLDTCLQHHERLDGSGYPRRLKGDQISVFGRIMAVADSFTAMTRERCYAQALPPINAVLLLTKDKKKYDQSLCKLLLDLKLDTDGQFKDMFEKAVRSNKNRDNNGRVESNDATDAGEQGKPLLVRCQTIASDIIFKQCCFAVCRYLHKKQRFKPRKIQAHNPGFKKDLRRLVLSQYILKIDEIRQMDQDDSAISFRGKVENAFAHDLRIIFQTYAKKCLGSCAPDAPDKIVGLMGERVTGSIHSKLPILSERLIKHMNTHQPD